MNEPHPDSRLSAEILPGLRCRRCGCNLAGLLPPNCCPACGSAVAISIPIGIVAERPVPRTVDSDIRCRRCGETLQGLPRDGFCRRCGLAVDESRDQAPSPAVGSDGTVVRDIPCRRCGYNLRGLRPDSRCPECGAGVTLSIRGDLLCFSDPAWVARLARGALRVFAGMLLWVGAIVLVIVTIFTRRAGESALMWLLLAGVAIGSILVVIGAWMITSPDPSNIGENKHVTSRRLVRGALLAGLVGLAISVLTTLLPSPAPPVQLAIETALFALNVFGIAGMVAYFFHLGLLARRVPDRRLARFSRGVGRALAIFLGILAANGAVMLGFFAYEVLTGTNAYSFTPRRPTRGSGGQLGLWTAYMCLTGLAMIGTLFSLLLAIVVQARIGSASEKQRKLQPTIGGAAPIQPLPHPASWIVQDSP